MSSIITRSTRLKTGDDLTIRSGTQDDAKVLLEYLPAFLTEAKYLFLQPGEFRHTLEQERQWIKGFTEQNGGLLLLALIGNQLVGTLTCEQGDYLRTAHVGSLSMGVRERWRGKGIGSVLLETVIEWATATPILEKLCLSVFAANAEAIQLYRRMGFAEEGRLRKAIKFAPGSYADEVCMARFV